MTDGLKDAHRGAIIAVLAANARVERGVLFGSRATGTNAVTSDVDLALFGDRLTLTDKARLAAAIDEIPMAQSVDLLLYNSISDRTLLEHIRKHGVEWFARSNRPDVEPTISSTPNDWQQVNLGDVVRLVSGGTPSKKREDYWHGTIPWVSAKDMKQFQLRDTTHHITAEGLANGTKRVRAGTLLLLTRGMRLLKELPVCLTKEPMAFNQDVKALLPTDQVDASFLPYLVLGNKQRLLSLVDLAGHGTGRINSDELRTLDIRLPPRREQQAIARILGTLDDKIELNRRMNETLEAMAGALFKSWFVDFDPVRAKMEGRDTGLPRDVAGLFPDRLVDSEMGEIPEGWATTKLGDLCHKPQYGYTASAQSEPIGPRFLRITDINKESWVSWSHVPYCEATDDDFSKYRLYKGDVLIARMADPGHGIVVEEDVEAVFASYLIRFGPVKNWTARLLQYWLRSDAYWHLVRSRATGTTRRSLNATVLSGFPLVVPSAGLAAAFATSVGAWRDQVVANVRETELLAALRDTLLPKLISGEVRLTDAQEAVEAEA